MNWRRLYSIIRKELRQLRRDPRLASLLIVTPVFQLILFGYAISTDLRGVRLGIVLEDPSPEARRLIQTIRGTDAFTVTEVSDDPAAPLEWLDSGRAQVTIQIPPGFTAALLRGQTPVIQVLSDGSDPNTATAAFQVLSRAAMAWAVEARKEYLGRHPGEASRYAHLPQVELQPRYWYNPGLRSVNFQIPGVLALLGMALTLTPTAMMVVKERELGTLEQISVTPIRPLELMVGKTVPIAVMGLVMTVAITLIAWIWFDVPVKGSLPFLFFCAALFQLNTLGLGLLLSMVSRTQLQAQLLASFITTPMIMLSGFLFPIENMPPAVQWFTYAIPMRYFMDVVRGVFLKGQGMAELWPQAAAIAGIGTLLYLAGVYSFRKRVE